MIAAARRPAPGGFAATLAAWRTQPSLPVGALLFVWALAPGFRRVFDWRTSFSSISLISALPLVAMLPLAYALIAGGRLKDLDRRLLLPAWLWFGGFIYAYAVGIAAGNLVAATYTFTEFALPALVGLWVATYAEPASAFYDRIATVLLALAAVLGVYAFYQFAVPPPWDLAWLERTKLVSIGIPAPFQFRPFSTLNSPGIFADFLTAAILFNLPRVRGANPLRVLQLVIVTATLALTMVRSDWIACFAGMIVYIALSPGKVKNLSIVGTLVVVVTVFAANAPALLGSGIAGNDLQHRFATFTDLETDSSYRDRQQYFGAALTTAIDQPTGAGLGVLGTAAKLGSAGKTVDFDNGYIARFTEMGYFGTVCYLATLFVTLRLAGGRWRRATRQGLREDAAIAAGCVAVQVAFALLDISSDHHNALGGLFYWLSVTPLYARPLVRAS
jgi:hypothetical protein